MNKVLNINLGRLPFTIDDDAHLKLTDYLNTLEKHFRNSEGHKEIMADIELRLAEIFSEKTEDRPIINVTDVESAINVMGTPEEFGAEESEGRQEKRRNYSWNNIQTGKKLFRDPENKVFGGVCSGLSAYFGIEDPIWVRLGFAIVFFTMGIGFLVYIVLWIAVPETKTSADRLAMRGEQANAQNIAKMVEEGLEDLSDTIKDFSKEFTSKKKSFKAASGASGSGAFQKGISFLKSIIYGLINAIRALFQKIFSKSDEFV
jgi:phage shock protein PspC (stress-responsive transcriptional regulator)